MINLLGMGRTVTNCVFSTRLLCTDKIMLGHLTRSHHMNIRERPHCVICCICCEFIKIESIMCVIQVTVNLMWFPDVFVSLALVGTFKSYVNDTSHYHYYYFLLCFPSSYGTYTISICCLPCVEISLLWLGSTWLHWLHDLSSTIQWCMHQYHDQENNGCWDVLLLLYNLLYAVIRWRQQSLLY